MASAGCSVPIILQLELLGKGPIMGDPKQYASGAPGQSAPATSSNYGAQQQTTNAYGAPPAGRGGAVASGGMGGRGQGGVAAFADPAATSSMSAASAFFESQRL